VATSWFFNGSGAANARVGYNRCMGRARSWSRKLMLAGVTSFRKVQSPAMVLDLTKPRIGRVYGEDDC